MAKRRESSGNRSPAQLKGKVEKQVVRAGMSPSNAGKFKQR